MRRHLLSAAAIATTAVLGSAGVAFATADVSHERYSGDDRYHTSALVADDTFTTATVAIIANGEKFPDALAASFVAGALDAPIILTGPDTLSSHALNALRAVDAEGALIVGGPAAISTNVQAQLEAELGGGVSRVGGDDRYETARLIAESIPEEAIGSINPAEGRTAFVATGEVAADALSAGGAAYAGVMPMLLTTPGALHSETKLALTNLEIGNVVLLGGEQAVSAAVKTEMEGMGIAVTRLGGANRSATAASVADLAISELGFSTTHVNLVRGDHFPDALSSSPHAGEELAVTLLTESSTVLGEATRAWLAENQTVSSLEVFGGTLAISDAVVSAAKTAAGDADGA